MPDTQVERISQLDIGDGKLYEFAGANNGMVFNDVTEALAAIQAGTVADGDVFYIKNDGTSGYPVFIGTSAQIATADNAGKIPAGMLIFCTDDGVNDITALQVGYDNTDSGLEADTVQEAIDELSDELLKTDSFQITLEANPYVSPFTYVASYDTHRNVVGATVDTGNDTSPALPCIIGPEHTYIIIYGNHPTVCTVNYTYREQ